MHSHEYKNPNEFKDKTVCILGAAASGTDLSREIATVSDKCYLFAKKHGSGEAICGQNKNIYNITGTID